MSLSPQHCIEASRVDPSLRWPTARCLIVLLLLFLKMTCEKKLQKCAEVWDK
jgi:hypothetical protein